MAITVTGARKLGCILATAGFDFNLANTDDRIFTEDVVIGLQSSNIVAMN